MAHVDGGEVLGARGALTATAAVGGDVALGIAAAGLKADPGVDPT